MFFIQMDYRFAYEVKDPATTNFQNRIEVSKNGKVRGSYSLLAPDGVLRTTVYSDDGYGYRATLHEQPTRIKVKGAHSYLNFGKNKFRGGYSPVPSYGAPGKAFSGSFESPEKFSSEFDGDEDNSIYFKPFSSGNRFSSYSSLSSKSKGFDRSHARGGRIRPFKNVKSVDDDSIIVLNNDFLSRFGLAKTSLTSSQLLAAVRHALIGFKGRNNGKVPANIYGVPAVQSEELFEEDGGLDDANEAELSDTEIIDENEPDLGFGLPPVDPRVGPVDSESSGKSNADDVHENIEKNEVFEDKAEGTLDIEANEGESKTDFGELENEIGEGKGDNIDIGKDADLGDLKGEAQDIGEAENLEGDGQINDSYNAIPEGNFDDTGKTNDGEGIIENDGHGDGLIEGDNDPALTQQSSIKVEANDGEIHSDGLSVVDADTAHFDSLSNSKSLGDENIHEVKDMQATDSAIHIIDDNKGGNDGFDLDTNQISKIEQRDDNLFQDNRLSNIIAPQSGIPIIGIDKALFDSLSLPGSHMTQNDLILQIQQAINRVVSPTQIISDIGNDISIKEEPTEIEGIAEAGSEIIISEDQPKSIVSQSIIDEDIQQAKTLNEGIDEIQTETEIESKNVVQPATNIEISETNAEIEEPVANTEKKIPVIAIDKSFFDSFLSSQSSMTQKQLVQAIQEALQLTLNQPQVIENVVNNPVKEEQIEEAVSAKTDIVEPLKTAPKEEDIIESVNQEIENTNTKNLKREIESHFLKHDPFFEFDDVTEIQKPIQSKTFNEKVNTPKLKGRNKQSLRLSKINKAMLHNFRRINKPHGKNLIRSSLPRPVRLRTQQRQVKATPVRLQRRFDNFDLHATEQKLESPRYLFSPSSHSISILPAEQLGGFKSFSNSQSDFKSMINRMVGPVITV